MFNFIAPDANSCLQQFESKLVNCRKKVKGKGFPYSIPSVGPGADPGV